MALWRNQKEILKRHALLCGPRPQLHPLALSKEERDGISQLHARKMDTDARARARTEWVESRASVWAARFGWGGSLF